MVAVVGSGIMAERLAAGNIAVTLLANTFATVAALAALIVAFEPVSAQFNPIVTLSAAFQRRLAWGDAIPFVVAQIAGAVAGAVCAHAMFELPLIAPSQHARGGAPQLLGEFVATLGLLAVIESATRRRPAALAAAVAAWIGAAYWCTSSTSFANPAVTIARSLSDTFVGIRPADVPGFILAQIAGGAAATFAMRALFATSTPRLPARRPAPSSSNEPRVGFRHTQPRREGGRPAPSDHRVQPGRRAPSSNRPDLRPPLEPRSRPDLRTPADSRAPSERGPSDRGPDDRGPSDGQRGRRRRGGRPRGGSDRPRGGPRYGPGEGRPFRPPAGDRGDAPDRGGESPGFTPRPPSSEGPPPTEP